MPMSKVAVLVVEDVPQVRATAVRIMQDLGCTVFDAYNGTKLSSCSRLIPRSRSCSRMCVCPA
jgi:CheY-like chemotaxis protein